MSKELIVALVGDSTKFTKSLDDADQKATGFGGGIGKLAAAAGGLFAGAKILDFGKDAVVAFDESAASQAKLTQALQASPATIGVTADSFAKLNKELARHTIADDDIIAAGEGVLATFGLTKQQIEDTIPGVVDLAAKLGTDVPGAADVVGKALLGNTKALKQLGVEGFAATGDHATDLANLMGLLDTKTRGAAQSQLDAAGPGAKFNKSMDELKETVGSYLVPALQKVTAVAVKVSDFFATHPAAVKLAAALGILAAGIWGVNAAVDAWTAAQAALNAVLAANPLVLIIGGIALLAAGLYELYQHFEPVHTAVDAMWQILQGAFNWAKDNWPLLLGILTGPIGLAVVGIVTHWTTIKNGFTDVKNWIGDRIGDVVGFFTGMPGRIAKVTGGMWDGIKEAFRGAVNWIIGAWNGLEFKIPGFHQSIFGKEVGFDGFTLGVPDIKFLARGGDFDGVAVVGEKGPEVLVGRGTVIPNDKLGGGSGPIVVQLVVDGQVLAEVVHSRLLQKQARGGALGFEAA